MSASRVLGLAAVAAMLAAPALAIAQTNDSAGAPVNPPPSAESSSANTSGTVLSSDQVSPSQAQALQNGDNRMVTNGPVPDTPSNRAKYGGPMSNAGKRTAPAGN